MNAALGNNLDKVKKLLYNGANLNVVSFDANSALHYASYGPENNFEITKLLISYGADVNVRNSRNATPLFWAVWYGHVDNCRALINHGSDCNHQNDNGWTPLHCAALQGHENVCSLLLHHGSKCNAENKSGYTPLRFAAEHGHKNICHLLIDYGATK
jgi:ankyrin repeat protein